jgi:undecaprenyl diphosphate synthase
MDDWQTTENELERQRAAIIAGNVPKHIAIIMDGNGRWAQQRGLTRTEGHRHAIRSIRHAVNACVDIGVNVLSMFAFSTENVDRPMEEVSELFSLFSQTLDVETARLKAEGVRFIISGDLSILNEALAQKFLECVDETSANSKLVLNMCVMYSGRHEIARAARLLVEEALAGRVRPENISMSHLAERMYHPELPDPDLLIRTSGELRLSNFMLWELAYTELYFTPVLWPDFTPADLFEAVLAYQRRDRRFGRIN